MKNIYFHCGTKRSQIISVQIAPTLMLIATFVIASFDQFVTASDAAKYLTFGVAAVTGILTIISQCGAIRKAQALVRD